MMRNSIDPTVNIGQLLFKLCLAVPWERMLVKPAIPRDYYRRPVYIAPVQPAGAPRSVPQVRAVVHSPALVSPRPRIDRPGCTAADDAAVALFHLNGLARGNGGFGVLRVSKERLETAAAAAEGLRQHEIAAEYRAIAIEMPSVHTPEEAQALHDRLEPVVYERSWDLGRKCKGAIDPEDMAEIKALAAKIAARQKE
jgi:hypothetical protein